MNSPPYYSSSDAPNPLHYHLPHHSLHSLLNSSRSLIEQNCTPSLNEILAAYKYSKGQDGDCQLLIAVLNAKSAEDQRLAAVAKLHATMLEFEHNPSSPSTLSSSSSSSSSSHPPPHMSAPIHRSHYAHSSYVRSEKDSCDREGKRSSTSSLHSRSPYERPPMVHPRRSRTHTQELPPSPYSSQASDSSVSSPRAREAMAIDSLLSPTREEAPQSSEHGGSRS